MKRKKINGRGLLAAVVLLFLGVFSLVNLKLSKDPAKKFLKKETTFKELAEEVRTNYTSDDFSSKTSFVNVNGLFVRTIGQRECNDIILLKNNMLSQVIEKSDMEKQADAIVELAEYTKQLGIPFLYVQAPYKEDKEDKLYPIGRKSNANENADDLLQLLSEGQVESFDLRPMLSETVDQINRYYFKTDHHWNFTGAFVGFREVTKKIAQMFPDEEIDMTYTQWDQWESHTLKNWWLGSRGKRVGQWFAGVDDFTWYTPAFETDMSCAVPKYRALYDGDFTDAVIRKQYIEEKDYFGYNAYCTYIGGDYPLVQHRNNQAGSNLKVLIIKDSYAIPLQSYLSTVFAEVDVVDPRHFKECSVAEYIRRTTPDLVLTMMNPSVFGVAAYTDFGADEALKNEALEEHLVWEREIIVDASENNNYKYASVAVEYGKTYTVSFEDVSFLQGEAPGVVTSLYNKTTKTLLANGVHDLAYGQENGGFCWTFNTPAKGKDELWLIFYAGLPGETAGVGAKYTGVQLYEWKY